jgi:DNA-directed RNA polymerase specialized sigma24 family protein
MPRVDGTTNAQTTFLRAFRTNPAGPAPADWPSPAILRRWLRRPAFVRALTSLREALRFRAQFHLANAANQAAEVLHDPVQRDALSSQQVRTLFELLRADQIRQRNPTKDAGAGESREQAKAATSARKGGLAIVLPGAS